MQKDFGWLNLRRIFLRILAVQGCRCSINSFTLMVCRGAANSGTCKIRAETNIPLQAHLSYHGYSIMGPVIAGCWHFCNSRLLKSPIKFELSGCEGFRDPSRVNYAAPKLAAPVMAADTGLCGSTNPPRDLTFHMTARRSEAA